MGRHGAQNALRWTSHAERLRVFALHAAAYRLLGGRLVGRHTLLLTTSGRRSGRARTTPLLYLRDGDDYIIVASNGGDDRYPGWWHNLRAEPNVRIQVGRAIVACRGERVSVEDARCLWPGFVAIHAGYERYRAATTRELTMFRLRPTVRAEGVR
jgi:deazaflavin-dependent oxidoreductase (nitroreductase family)